MSTAPPAELSKRLAKFSNLPSIPQTILQIKEVSEDPKATAVDLANCILSDHQLTSRILRMANSAYYGDYAGKITTVTQGIVVMGFRAVHNIAVSMAIYGVINDISKAGKFDMTAFWTRSLASGVMAKSLMHRLNKPGLLETAFIAGFLHDIGQVLLASVFPDKYQQISKLDPENPEICQTERVLLGLDHLDAGRYVADKWNLPIRLARPLYEHHRIGKEPCQKSDDILVDLVYLSDILYRYVMSENEPEPEILTELARLAGDLIDVTETDITELITSCREQVTEIACDLEIDIDGQMAKRPVSGEDMAEVHQELSNKEIQLAFLQNATTALMEAVTKDEIHQIICEAVFSGMRLGRVILFEAGPSGTEFRGRIGFGVKSQVEVKQLRFSTSQSVFGHVRDSGQILNIVGDSREIYGSLISQQEIDRLEVESFALIPIKILGTVELVMLVEGPHKTEPLDDEAVRSMTSLANQGAMSLERLALQERLKQQGTEKH